MKLMSERIQIDDTDDYIVIDGFRFAGPALDLFVTPSAPGHWFRIQSCENGIVMFQSKIE